MYKPILGKILNEGRPYVVKVILKRFGERKGVLWTHREIRYQYSFYLEHFKTVARNSGKLFGDVDVNVN